MLALVARYVRLATLVVVIAGVASVPVAAATGVAAFLFRVGNRGGLRKFAAVWREVAGKLRRARYLAELGISGPAAKELRIFGLVGFLRERYTQAFFEIYDRVSSRRREIYYRPYLFFTAIGLGAAAWAMVSLGVGAASGGVSLGAVALGVQAVTIRNALANRPKDIFRVNRTECAAFHFLHNHQALAVFGLHRESSAALRLERGMAPGDGIFDILRVVVAATDNDEVLRAPGNEQAAAVHESQITRSQKRPVPACRSSLEDLTSIFFLAPVTSRDARTSHPDLANAIACAFSERLWINDDDAPVLPRATATHERL